MGAEPSEGVPGIVVRRREGVFRGEAAVGGDDKGGGRGGEVAEVAVVELREGGSDAEAATVEVE